MSFLTTSQRWKWGLVFRVYLATLVAVPIIILACRVIGGDEFIQQASVDYAGIFGCYFRSWDGFVAYVKDVVVNGPISEEIWFRGVVWALAVSNIRLIYRGLDATKPITWILLTALTLFWSISYPSHIIHYSIFTAGMFWGWLVIKTKSLWPAIVSHSLANLTIYFAVKLFLPNFP